MSLREQKNLPGFWDGSLPKIPEKGTWDSMYFEEPNRVNLREEHDDTVLHQPPPYTLKWINGYY